MNKNFKYIIAVILILPFLASAALLSPGRNNGLLTPQVMVFTNDITGAVPSDGINIGASNQTVPVGYFTNLNVTGTCQGCGDVITGSSTAPSMAAWFVGTSTTQKSTFAGGVSGSNATQANSYVEAKKPSEAYARSYLDGFGSLFFGGLGSATAPLKLSKDAGTPAWANLTNTAGPASILIVDSDAGVGTCSTGTNDAESTLTLRSHVNSSAGSEFMDLFHDCYPDNQGNTLNGLLFQNTGTGVPRDFIMGFYGKADTDSADQINNAQIALSISTSTVSGVAGNYSNGLVGIQKRYANAVLDVNNSTTTTPFMISDSTGVGVMSRVGLIYTTSGKFGIGTSTPSTSSVMDITESSTSTVPYDIMIGTPNVSGGDFVTVDANGTHNTCTEWYSVGGVGLTKAVTCPTN